MIKPIVAKAKREFSEFGQPFPGILLIEDNFKPHFAEYTHFVFPIYEEFLQSFLFLLGLS